MLFWEMSLIDMKYIKIYIKVNLPARWNTEFKQHKSSLEINKFRFKCNHNYRYQ